MTKERKGKLLDLIRKGSNPWENIGQLKCKVFDPYLGKSDLRSRAVTVQHCQVLDLPDHPGHIQDSILLLSRTPVLAWTLINDFKNPYS